MNGLNNDTLISVIVPVYNVKIYLEKCINSILAQTFSNFELIIIDDGSTDGSGKLCDILTKRDSRIICIHKENGGLSSARNVGLEICRGDFITFVDSDDMISPNAFEVMLRFAIKYNSDIVVTKNTISYSSNDVNPTFAEVGSYNIYERNKALTEILCHTTRWEAWGHLFKKALWKNIRFPQGVLYEDLATIPYVFNKADKVLIIDTAIYYYYQRPDSIMRLSEKKVSQDLCSVSMQLIKDFKTSITHDVEFTNICSGVLMELCSRTDLASQNIENNYEFVNRARKILKENVKLMMQSNYYSLKQKIYYLLEAYGLHNLIYCVHRKGN